MFSASELLILDYIQEHFRSDFLDWLLPKITVLANAGILWVGIAIIFLCVRSLRRCGLEMALSMLLCFIIGNLLLKPFIARIRPYDLNPISLLISAPRDFSFPSGHTYTSFAAATAIFFHKKSWGIAALVLSTMIAFSRLYLYVHYPTDVLVGIVLGVLLAIAAHFILPKMTHLHNRPSA